jgi:hypothetical protein
MITGLEKQTEAVVYQNNRPAVLRTFVILLVPILKPGVCRRTAGLTRIMELVSMFPCFHALHTFAELFLHTQ